MRGYVITPIVFLAVFVIVAAFAFYVSQSDSRVSSSIIDEGLVKKAELTTTKKLIEFTNTAFQAMADNPGINNRTEMESEIEARLAAAGAEATVTLSKKPGNKTGVRLDFADFDIDGTNNITISLDGETYEEILGHPFAHLSDVWLAFDADDACASVTPACGFDEADFAARMRAAHGWKWDYTDEGSNGTCPPGIDLRFSVKISDDFNTVSLQRPLELQDRTDGDHEFSVFCPK